MSAIGNWIGIRRLWDGAKVTAETDSDPEVAISILQNRRFSNVLIRLDLPDEEVGHIGA